MNNGYSPFVFDSTVTDFPSVVEMPKREKSKWRKLWDDFHELNAFQAEHGGLLPRTMAARLLDVHPTRIDQLIEDGRLVSKKFNGRVFVSENSFVAYGQSERKVGRPLKVIDALKTDNAALWKLSKESSKEFLKK